MSYQPGNHPQVEDSAYYDPYQSGSNKEKKSKKGMVLFFVLHLVVGLFLFVKFFFQIKGVEVVGNQHRTDEEVMALAGVGLGDNLLLVSKAQVEEQIDKDRYLIFRNFYRIYPNQLFIQVYERIPVASITYMGVSYTTDMEGMVLEQAETIEGQEGLITVKGMDLRQCKLGNVITSGNTQQFLAFKKLMEEVSYQSFAQGISECNISNEDNIYLTSTNGYTVRLGDATDMRAKIAALKLVIDELERLNASLGSIDVSSPVYPIFIPNP